MTITHELNWTDICPVAQNTTDLKNTNNSKYSSSLITLHPPAGDLARRRRRHTLPSVTTELTLVQLALVSDVLAGAHAELGAI